ncbi:hypothetical protein M3Y97_00299200 [Aphelenchoides bicaudatus]|nr:hypothetical protein M3Y97_00299200 [Aphelenchoides bicaudatus]
MQKLAFFLLLALAIVAVNAESRTKHLRAKRQLYGPGPIVGPLGGPVYPPMAGGVYGPGLTAPQIAANRALANAQLRGRQMQINAQMASNRAIQQATFNANALAAEARANAAEARANALMLGK